MNKFYYVFCLIFVWSFGYSQAHLFVKTDLEVPVLTEDVNFQIPLSLNTDYFTSIKENQFCDIIIKVPFFDNTVITLNLQSFNAFTNDFYLLRSTQSGLVYDDYQPDIQSYRILGNNISGSVSFMKDVLIGVIKFSGNLYEIMHIENNIYVLYDVNKSTADFNFTCQTTAEYLGFQNNNQPLSSGGGGTECVEMGIDIDNYTYNQFNQNCYDAVEWSLALLAGVSEIFMSELQNGDGTPMVFLQARYINVWQIIDNYDPLNDTSPMLDELQNYWTNPPFDEFNAQTDLVHLFTRKEAGGGIAYTGGAAGAGVACDSFSGFAVSSGLSTDLSYNYPDNTPASWNMNVISHETGHNFGSPHTHWCGWEEDVAVNFPGGAIDGCYEVEGVDTNFDGVDDIFCDPPASPPGEVWQQDIGTIMSYCHLSSVGITLEFHSVVQNQALIPGINNANCFTSDCDDLETSCDNAVYGCTDEIAENFNPQANIDDNSCEYIYGCTSANADNFNPDATQDDGSCEYLGCTDSNYLEYWIYNPIEYSITDPEFIPNVDDGSCLTLIVYGCTVEEGMFNYNPDANVNDGSCICAGEIDLYLETDYYSSEISWELLNDEGQVLYSGGDYLNGGEIIDNTYCLMPGCYSFNIYDEWGDGISSNNTAGNNPNFYIFLLLNNSYLVEMEDSNFGNDSENQFCICASDNDNDNVCDEDEVYGCTDDLYLEFNIAATEDDGSCLTLIVEGCTDDAACNYNVDANIDNNSCEYPPIGFDCDNNCLSDINNDGICDIFGCMNSDACNYDDTANIDDDNCAFPLLNFDCDGNCIVTVDCNGNCGGDAELDECGICNGDNTTCLGCTDMFACNYDIEAIISDDSCEYPNEFYDCDGNCIATVDCAGLCGGSTVYDECGECGGSGALEFYDCDGNCISDIDNDGYCDQIDNCFEDYNPSQLDSDNDGYGDECSCQYIEIQGEITIEAGEYEVYTLSSSINNMASWGVVGGDIVWSSANEPSIGVQWLEVGQGAIIITQYYGINETCEVTLDVTVIPSSTNLLENSLSKKQLIMVTDVLGRSVNMDNEKKYIIRIFNDGSVEKIYNFD